MPEITIPVVAGAMLAGFIQGLTGFAYGLVAMSVWVWVLDPQTAAALVVVGALSGQVSTKLVERKRRSSPRLIPYLVGGGVGLAVGFTLLPFVSVTGFRLSVGIFLMVWCPIMLMWRRIPAVTASSRAADALVGSLAGGMAAFGGLSGPLPVLWTSLQRLEKAVQREIVQEFNLLILAVTFVGYVATGQFRSEFFPIAGAVVPITLMATFLGRLAFSMISQSLFRTILLLVLTGSGAAIVSSTQASGMEPSPSAEYCVRRPCWIQTGTLR
ncbi:MAG: sulfite exporter TauE/SafE family protein [Rhizobium sp.]|nr:sulfite exporter TauE/SafE family protein [Rhizobium sp.]